MDRQQGGHRRERGADQDGARVAAPRARDRQRDGRRRGEARAHGYRQEVDRSGDLHLRLPEEVHDRAGHDRARGEQPEHGDGPLGAPDLDIETRILAVCDVFDALLSDRVYRDAWTLEDALDLISREGGPSSTRRAWTALEWVIARERDDDAAHQAA